MVERRDVLSMRCVVSVLLLSGLLVNASFGESDISESEVEVNADVSDSAGNKAWTESGVIDADVEMTGIAVINGAVWIDGVKIHKPQSVYTSKKNGKTYRIHWGKNDNVSVTEE
jgi:hypothetical protein